MYDQWMGEGPHTHTKGDNVRGSPFKQIVQWILKACSDLDKAIINHFIAVLCQYRMMGVRTKKLHISNQEIH